MSSALAASSLLASNVRRIDTVIGSFILGAIVGGAAVWYYGPQVRTYVDEASRSVRSRAADTLQSAAESLQSARQAVEPGGSTGTTGSTGMAGGAERRVV